MLRTTASVAGIVCVAAIVVLENCTLADHAFVRVIGDWEKSDGEKLPQSVGDEVEVGDMVDVEFVQHMDLEVAALGDVTPGAGTMSAMARAPDDQRPGMIATETLVLAATVHAIDLEAGTFQLQWSEGIKEYVARDPENLKRAEVGDTVIVTFTEAIAMQLQEVPAED